MRSRWPSAIRRRRDRRGGLAAAVVMAAVAACEPVPAVDVGGRLLDGGAAIGSIAAPRGESVVLVLSPADCVSCDVDLARWFAPGRDTAVPVAVVLTRSPTPEESRGIALMRLPVRGRLADGADVRSPCVLRFRDGIAVSPSCDDDR